MTVNVTQSYRTYEPRIPNPILRSIHHNSFVAMCVSHQLEERAPERRPWYTMSGAGAMVPPVKLCDYYYSLYQQRVPPRYRSSQQRPQGRVIEINPRTRLNYAQDISRFSGASMWRRNMAGSRCSASHVIGEGVLAFDRGSRTGSTTGRRCEADKKIAGQAKHKKI
jgi:hypothetical protein